MIEQHLGPVPRPLFYSSAHYMTVMRPIHRAPIRPYLLARNQMRSVLLHSFQIRPIIPLSTGRNTCNSFVDKNSDPLRFSASHKCQLHDSEVVICDSKALHLCSLATLSNNDYFVYSAAFG